MKVIAIASGSSGNCTFVETDGTRVLIDCGISVSSAVRELSNLDIEPSSIDAILVTHEHRDHIDGVFPFARRFGVPVYLNPLTFGSTKKKNNGVVIQHFSTGDTFNLGNADIEAFSISHDTADPVGYMLRSCEGDVVQATDLGRANGRMADLFEAARVIVMDFNHDLEMLVKGPYPVYLKERIAGMKGHLSNETAAKFLADLDLPNLEALFLAHLSRTNNLPKLARNSARSIFENRSRKPQIITADQYRVRGVEFQPQKSNN